MFRLISRPLPLAIFLLLCTAIGTVMAGFRVVQIPLGLVPEDSMRLMVAPSSIFLHALAGVTFGLLGPLQFAGVLQRRFGAIHRVTGRIFGIAGLALGLSGLSLQLHVESVSTPLLDAARAFFGLALIAALLKGYVAIRSRDLRHHRIWMIRSYVVGMAPSALGLVMFPIYIIRGVPPQGIVSDIIFVAWWCAAIALGEWVIRRNARPAPPAESSPGMDQFAPL